MLTFFHILDIVAVGTPLLCLFLGIKLKHNRVELSDAECGGLDSCREEGVVLDLSDISRQTGQRSLRRDDDRYNIIMDIVLLTNDPMSDDQFVSSVTGDGDGLGSEVKEAQFDIS